jgi:NAD(P)-dependent dehydrogenase (short-subunit alcohol dehydrogenase family)
VILGGSGGIVACCAVKAGIDVMTGSPARALAPKIRVMGVAPGVVDTDFAPGRDATFKAKAAAGIPPKRIAAPEDAAAAILACATPLRYPTGSTTSRTAAGRFRRQSVSVSVRAGSVLDRLSSLGRVSPWLPSFPRDGCRRPRPT